MTTSRALDWPIWANGRLYESGTPVIDAEDQGFLLGLAVFDTVLLEKRCILFLEEHIQRLQRGAEELSIPWPPPWDPAAAFHEMGDVLGDHTAVLRMTLSLGVPGKGSTLVITPRPVTLPPAEGIKVLVSSHKKLGGSQLEGVKSNNRMRNMLARQEAASRGAWEAILANASGDLSEGTISNLFVVQGGALRTPPTDRGCLSGITREKILESVRSKPLRASDGSVLELALERIDPACVFEADELFLTNTSGRVIPVVEVLGMEREVKGLPGPKGPVVRELRTRMAAIEEAYRAAHS